MINILLKKDRWLTTAGLVGARTKIPTIDLIHNAIFNVRHDQITGIQALRKYCRPSSNDILSRSTKLANDLNRLIGRIRTFQSPGSSYRGICPIEVPLRIKARSFRSMPEVLPQGPIYLSYLVSILTYPNDAMFPSFRKVEVTIRATDPEYQVIKPYYDGDQALNGRIDSVNSTPC